MGFVIRLSILLAVLVISFLHGGFRGMFYGFIAFGLLAFAWYTIIDTWNRAARSLSRPKVMVDARSVNIMGDPVQARRGVPTTDDFAGLIQQREHFGRHRLKAKA